MAAFTSMAISAAGLGLSIYGSTKAAKAQKAYINAQSDANANIEQARRRQMELDAHRRAKEIIRQGQRARALSLANATNQGAEFGSGIMGGIGQISGQMGTNLTGVSQNLALGRDIFDANATITQASATYASKAGRASYFHSLGSGLMAFGGLLSQNSKNIDALRTYYGNVNNPHGTTEATGLYDPWEGMRGQGYSRYSGNQLRNRNPWMSY